MVRALSMLVACVFMFCLAAGQAQAQLGTQEFAQRMSARGGLYHDPMFRGAEVVYRSSGIATQEAAMASWMRSPPHRALVTSGKITEVSCSGGVCVGRGPGVSMQRTTTTTRSRQISRRGLLGRIW